MHNYSNSDIIIHLYIYSFLQYKQQSLAQKVVLGKKKTGNWKENGKLERKWETGKKTGNGKENGKLERKRERKREKQSVLKHLSRETNFPSLFLKVDETSVSGIFYQEFNKKLNNIDIKWAEREFMFVCLFVFLLECFPGHFEEIAFLYTRFNILSSYWTGFYFVTITENNFQWDDIYW